MYLGRLFKIWLLGFDILTGYNLIGLVLIQSSLASHAIHCQQWNLTFVSGIISGLGGGKSFISGIIGISNQGVEIEGLLV